MKLPIKKLNFGAGPAKIPEEVMQKAADEFHVYPGAGVSILEMSHRSKEFTEVLNQTEKLLREEMSMPNEFEVLFMQGGATGQFAAIPMNLKGDHDSADFMVTGTWSSKAASEASKYLNVNYVFPPPKPFVSIPEQSEWRRNEHAAYLHYCANETVHGVQFPTPPESLSGVPLVADVSSEILSRPFSFHNHGVVFGGTQKNLGGAGLTLAMVRRDLLGRQNPMTPSVFTYAEMAKHRSVYNTPSVYGIYLTKLVLEWIRDNGGVNELFERNKAKASLIYELIDNSQGFYCCPVDAKYRSLMNLPFRVGGVAGNEELEAKFLLGAQQQGMIGLKGHRSVGGIRASLYNAVTMQETMQLGEYMSRFLEEHA